MNSATPKPAARPKAKAFSTVEKVTSRHWATPAWTLEERLQRIQALGLRIEGYVRFMCQVATLTGASAEAKERAVVAFYEKIILVEKQLGDIQESLRLE